MRDFIRSLTSQDDTIVRICPISLDLILKNDDGDIHLSDHRSTPVREPTLNDDSMTLLHDCKQTTSTAAFVTSIE